MKANKLTTRIMIAMPLGIGVGYLCNLYALLKLIREPAILASAPRGARRPTPRRWSRWRSSACPTKVTGFVLPLGYSFNLDGR